MKAAEVEETLGSSKHILLQDTSAEFILMYLNIE